MAPVPKARICCLDLDCFFVSVERLLDPELVGKPVIVGAAKGNRGVVTACSYEVRPLGVRSGMPMAEARRLAPHAIYLPTQHRRYGPYAKRVRDVLMHYTPAVQTASIDEFFLDFSGCERLWRLPFDADGDATIERIVREMRLAIQADVGLPSSAGIGTTRAIAKMASGVAKPAGVRMVRAGDEPVFVAPLPVRRFPGIGPVAGERLQRLGIETLGQLLALPPGPEHNQVRKLAATVRRAIHPRRTDALGRDRPAFREHDPEGLTVGSISNERTFGEDVSDPHHIERQLRSLAERVCWRARKRSTQARTITLKLRYADFETLTRARSVRPTNEERVVHRTIMRLFHDNRGRRTPIRLLGVALTNLVPKTGQLDLPFGLGREAARPPAGAAVDAVRERFGYDAIRLGVATSKTGRSSWVA